LPTSFSFFFFLVKKKNTVKQEFININQPSNNDSSKKAKTLP